MRSEVDADRLFKTEGKDPGKQSSSEDDLADELARLANANITHTSLGLL